jgi:segregation and condensation protein A
MAPEMDISFEAPLPAEDAGTPLMVDVEGFEGPLDLLLALARTQKVDLKKISIGALADQYLLFIAEARKLKLELAADYLVMAAWLAYLKSRLLLPEPGDDEPTGEELAARLAFELQRLEAMRGVAARLMARDRLGREVFARGMPEGIYIARTTRYEVPLYDLLKAYGDGRVRHSVRHLEIRPAPVYRVEEARRRLEAMLGAVIKDWNSLEALLPQELRAQGLGRSALASTLMASLELVREGTLDMRQLSPFGPVYIRQRSDRPAEVPTTPEREEDDDRA